MNVDYFFGICQTCLFISYKYKFAMILLKSMQNFFQCNDVVEKNPISYVAFQKCRSANSNKN
jgi:hypothetical protein